ncbi:hypothetical protein N7509_003910 [Penicillium cosmopolitanum]|uniref:Uncharacterized protein n=1 Tax=Penicillium cosmopolitanum TaxID=1131564 RepID=A0A9X0BBX7_9EURO|nr:uncharacterized protein N7509_003910 [Penicillium cosmopolitanum]KAJ5404039.1 hypothetical protein N7509_003910 [Penicillium cosmopolitanum]
MLAKEKTDVRERLSREPECLPVSLWRLLKRYDLVYTTTEELSLQLTRSEPATLPNTRYAQEFDHTIRALFAAEPQTRLLQTKYVKGNDRQTDLAFSRDARIIFIHERWLSFDTAHARSYCPAKHVLWLHDSSFCEHILNCVYLKATFLLRSHLLGAGHGEVTVEETIQALCLRGRDRLQAMPRAVRASVLPHGQTVRIEWEDGYSRAGSRTIGSHIDYHVTLHGASCAQQRNALFFTDPCSCSCPMGLASQRERSITFESPDSEMRFPMVARNERNSIFGFIPPSCGPILGIDPVLPSLIYNENAISQEPPGGFASGLDGDLDLPGGIDSQALLNPDRKTISFPDLSQDIWTSSDRYVFPSIRVTEILIPPCSVMSMDTPSSPAFSPLPAWQGPSPTQSISGNESLDEPLDWKDWEIREGLDGILLFQAAEHIDMVSTSIRQSRLLSL